MASLPGGPDIIRVLVADDHRMARAGLALLLKMQGDIDVVGEADDGYEALRLTEALAPDILLADISMPGPGGIELAARLRETHARVRVVVLTMHEDVNLVREALAAGAYGYVVKRAAEAELIAAIRGAARGEVYIDSQIQRLMGRLPGADARVAHRNADSAESRVASGAVECSAPLPMIEGDRELLSLLARGYTMHQIAAALQVDTACAERMRAELTQRLGLHSRVEIMRFARDHDLLGSSQVKPPVRPETGRLEQD